MIRLIREKLSVKISLRLTLLAVPLLSIVVWWIAHTEKTFAREALLNEGRVAALSGASAYGAVLEYGIDSGQITLEDLLEPVYEEIKYTGFKIEDQRYHTKYDKFTDTHGIQRIEDAILASSSSFTYASGMDIRGYVPTPHTKYAEDPNGDPVHDRAVSRAKRKYDGAEQLAAAGYFGKEPTLVQEYPRDTGELVWDIAAPIIVKGKHFGGFRVGVLQDQIEVKVYAVAIAFARILGITMIILIMGVLWSTSRAMRPLSKLANTAVRLSMSYDGEELKNPIKVASVDEVGRMGKALDRLRLSLLYAWQKDLVSDKPGKA